MSTPSCSGLPAESWRRCTRPVSPPISPAGCIRDLLLGCPVQDVDIATDAVPAEIQRLFPDHRAVGAQFSVILVKLEASCSRSPRSVPTWPTATGDIPKESVSAHLQRTPAAVTSPSTACSTIPAGGSSSTTSAAKPTWRPGASGRSARRTTASAKITSVFMRAVRFAAGLEFTIDAATRQSLRRLAPSIPPGSARTHP